MKPKHVLTFTISVLLTLAALSLIFPSQGLSVGNVTLKYGTISDFLENDADFDVDQNLARMHRELEINYLRSVYDTLSYYKNFIQGSPLRIHLPDDEYRFFDGIFEQFEKAVSRKKVYRIVHFGDSQIEMDRISGVLREHLQEIFGGSGPGLLPAIQPVPTYSISQSYSGNLDRYIMFGDSTTQRAGHRRYGPMAQFSTVYGSATIGFRQSRHSQAQPRVKDFRKVSVLLNKADKNLNIRVTGDTIVRIDTVKQQQATLISWTFRNHEPNVRMHINGQADVYGIMLDDKSGVALDNIPWRGSAGTIFTGIDKQLLRESFQLMNTPLIILQFGGNAIGGISSQTSIDRYMERLERQFEHLKEAAPDAKFLFIGPSDMSTSYNGVMKTRKFLPELNESLKNTCLRNGIAYWDLFQVMGGENSMAQWVRHSPPLAGSDHVHFTTAGAREIGNLLSRSFLTNYEFYKLRKKLNDDIIQTFWSNDYELISSPN